MLIAPGAIGLLLARRFDHMLAVAVSASVFSCVAGVLLSYHLDTATAPLIVVIEAMLFMGALLASKWSARRKRGGLDPKGALSLSARPFAASVSPRQSKG